MFKALKYLRQARELADTDDISSRINHIKLALEHASANRAANELIITDFTPLIDELNDLKIRGCTAQAKRVLGRIENTLKQLLDPFRDFQTLLNTAGKKPNDIGVTINTHPIVIAIPNAIGPVPEETESDENPDDDS